MPTAAVVLLMCPFLTKVHFVLCAGACGGGMANGLSDLEAVQQQHFAHHHHHEAESDADEEVRSLDLPGQSNC